MIIAISCYDNLFQELDAPKSEVVAYSVNCMETMIRSVGKDS